MERVMLRNFEPRLYQQTILGTAVNYNTLVVLPTGLGKTAIALMLAVQRLNAIPNSKVVILAPTRPLVEQHIQTFKKYLNLDEEYFAIFTGSVTPKKRVLMWEKARVVFSTPQGFENDIISSRIDISNVSLMVFDEAHRAVGNYSYVFIAEKYHSAANFPKILALTASPGSNIDKIKEVCKNLFIENIEVRTEKDPDVSPYVKKIKIFWEEVVFPAEFKEIRNLLKKSYEEKLSKASELLETDISRGINKKELLNLQNELHIQINETKNYLLMQASSLISQAIKIQHAIELLETQGISQLKNYFERFLESVSNTKVRAVKNLAKDLNFRTAIAKTQLLYDKGFEHPKMRRVLEIMEEYIKNKADIKIILFTQYRDSANKIIKELDKLGIKSKIFVGQMKKLETGLSQKEQKQIIEDFRNNNFNVLVSTSVGEEGLDIPQVDLVIFYEPIPSAIRQIQRRGRTGRQEEGVVIILYTKDTRDEAYMWAAFNKEKKMKRTLLALRNELMLKPENEKKRSVDLTNYIKNNSVVIIVDHREKNSRIIKELIDFGVKIELKSLEIADYVLSDRVAVEVKTTYDFLDSIIDGRLLEQIKSLKENYERPLIVIEGVEDIYSIRQVHKNAINGMITTIIVNYGIPMLWTKNSKETAEILFMIAKKEQEQKHNSFDFHSKKPLTLKEQQEYIISSFPGIGSALSKPLLKKFGNIKNIVNASEEELKRVELIGDKKAKQIRKVLDSFYEEYLNQDSNEKK
jgi:Fanconi anemia group M protein